MAIHDLRHTAASLPVASGANVKAVQKMLGHASAAMTLDVNTDLFDDALDAVAQRLDEAAQRWSKCGQTRLPRTRRRQEALRSSWLWACGADGA